MQKVALLSPPPAQVAATKRRALNLSDISTSFYDEPRVHDLLLAETLGFKRTYDIRELITRNKAELETYGALIKQQSSARPRIAEQPIDATINSVFPYRTENPKAPSRRGGRPTKEYWLNEGQSLMICTLARTTAAARVRRELITVFMAHRTGTLAAPVHVSADVGELALMNKTLDSMRADVNTLRRQVASLLGQFEQQAQALVIASKKAATKLVSSRVVDGPITPPAALLYGAGPIATYLNLTQRQARFLIDQGRIPAFRLGGRLCCTTEGLDQWMASMVADRKKAVRS